MPKTPTPEDIALPGIQGARPVAGYDVSALAQGGQALARGEQQLGAGIEHGANQVAEAQMYQARNSALLAQDTLLSDAITYRDEARHNPNLTPEQYNAGLDERVEKNLAPVPEGPLRDHARARAMIPIAREKASFNEQYISAQNNEERAALQNEADSLANSTGPADDPLHTAKVEQFGVKLQDATGRGVFKPTEARLLGQRLAIGIREGESKSRFRLGPDAAAAEVARLEAIQSRGAGMALNSFPPATGATISTIASRYGVDPATLGRAVQIESSGNPNAHTGSYKGILQLSDSEFEKYKPRPNADIWNMEDNLAAGAAKMRAEGGIFAQSFGRQPSGFDSYMIHQQGLAGYSAHLNNPNAPAWQNMLSTAEGRQKGEAWAKAAVWGNIPDQYKIGFGNVNNVSSGNFLGVWQQKWGGAGHAPQGNADATSLPRAQGGGTQTAQNIDDILPPAKLDALIREGHQILNGYRVDDDRAQREQDKQRKAASDDAEEAVLKDLYGPNPTMKATDIVNNDALSREAKERLVARVDAATGHEDIRAFGPGYADAYNAILKPSGEDGRITDASEILRRAAPGGDITPTGAQRLIAVMKEARGSSDLTGVHTTKSALLNYAKSKLSFDQEMLFPGAPPLRDRKGEQIFNAQFVPKFESAFDKWTKDGKDPMQFLTQENIDKMLHGLRSPNEMKMDRIAATGEAVPEAPNAPLPPTPDGLKPEAWVPLVSKPPMTEAGTPFPHRDWATALEMLARNPTPETIKLFNESKFGRAGFDGAKLAAQLRGEANAAAPSSEPSTSPAAVPPATVAPPADEGILAAAAKGPLSEYARSHSSRGASATPGTGGKQFDRPLLQ